jgi:hypothetical protein
MTVTMQKIHARCIECGDCWLWQGAGADKVPLVRSPGRGPLVPVRRVVLELRGITVGNRLAIPSCGNPQCVAPGHAKAATRAQLNQMTTDRLRYQQRASRNAKISQKARARASLDEAKVAEIRASDLPQRALAAIYGVSQSTIGEAKNGANWKDYSSPFLGLFPANDSTRRAA